jgi:peptidoglycan hydrolase CwlO-like protein
MPRKDIKQLINQLENRKSKLQNQVSEIAEQIEEVDDSINAIQQKPFKQGSNAGNYTSQDFIHLARALVQDNPGPGQR